MIAVVHTCAIVSAVLTVDVCTWQSWARMTRVALAASPDAGLLSIVGSTVTSRSFESPFTTPYAPAVVTQIFTSFITDSARNERAMQHELNVGALGSKSGTRAPPCKDQAPSQFAHLHEQLHTRGIRWIVRRQKDKITDGNSSDPGIKVLIVGLDVKFREGL